MLHMKTMNPTHIVPFKSAIPGVQFPERLRSDVRSQFDCKIVDVYSTQEIGRVVLTDPFNSGFPLIRYEIGDYAEMVEPCDCGRSWPVTSRRRISELGPIVQYQIIQTSLYDIQLNFVVRCPITDDEKEKIIEFIQEEFGYPFDIGINVVDAIARGANGKYKEFRSNVTVDMADQARAQK